MQFSALQINQLLQGTIEGNPDSVVYTVSKIEEGTNGSLCFLASPQYEPYLYQTQASIVIVSQDFQPKQAVAPTLIRVADPRGSFASLLKWYEQLQQPAPEISSHATIDATAHIGENVYIGAGVVVGKNASVGAGSRIYPNVWLGEGAQVGNNTILYAGVKVYHRCTIGNDCIIHAGTVVGSDGFGFTVNPQTGAYEKMPQIGNVIIENDVEIGANCTIDRATMGATRIRSGVKLDNLIQVGHNVEIGENTVIAAQTGIAGSTKLGKNCMVGGQVGFVGHIVVADGSKFGAKSGISKSIEQPNQAWNGIPVRGHRDSQKDLINIRKIGDLEQRIAALEKLIAQQQ